MDKNTQKIAASTMSVICKKNKMAKFGQQKKELQRVERRENIQTKK